MPGEALLTAWEAAREVGVDRDTIYTWVRRGYLVAVPDRKRGREHLYRSADVFACEARRKHQHRRKAA